MGFSLLSTAVSFFLFIFLTLYLPPTISVATISNNDNRARHNIEHLIFFYFALI